MTCPRCAGLGPAAIAPYQGPPGIAGSDYGYISYQQAAGSPLLCPAGQRNLLPFTPDPTKTRDRLKGPFARHTFWDGTRLRPHAVDDNGEIRLILTITSFVIGGNVVADIDIGGTIGSFETDPKPLLRPPSTPEIVRFLFVDYMAETFMANGGAFYLTPSVPIMVTSESLVVYPRGTAP